MKIKEGYMPYLEYKTYYRIVGENTGNKKPLVLLHGGPGSTHNYFEVLDRLAEELHLSKEERELFLDLAAASQKMKVPADLPEYIMERDIVRAALRTAKEVDATDEEWQEFIDRITKRTSKNRRDGP